MFTCQEKIKNLSILIQLTAVLERNDIFMVIEKGERKRERENHEKRKRITTSTLYDNSYD